MSWACERCGFENPTAVAECRNCEAPKGWEYDGPEDIDYDAVTAEERHQQTWEQKRRLR